MPPPPPPPAYTFFGGYVDDAMTMKRTSEEQRAFMEKEMQKPHHFEDERLGMDLIVPQLGNPDEYDHPYEHYQHGPLSMHIPQKSIDTDPEYFTHLFNQGGNELMYHQNYVQ